jgi:predicted nucleotidyltransferase
MADRGVVESTQEYMKALESMGFPIRFAVLFGSRAQGHADEWSDIDVVVVSPRFDGASRREDVSLLWRVAARTDSRIEPVPCGERQWVEDTSSAIIELARREGQRILPAA